MGQNGALVSARALANEAATGKYHAAAINGDISYAVGTAQRWDHYLYQIGDVSKYMPLITSMGNHEGDNPHLPEVGVESKDHGWTSVVWTARIFPSTFLQYAYPSGEDSGGECAVPYTHRMSPPTFRNKKQLVWYSKDVGPVHFLQLSTEQNFTIGSEQWLFAEKDLSSVDRSRTPWVIVGFHRPLYIDDADALDPPPSGNVQVAEMLKAVRTPHDQSTLALAHRTRMRLNRYPPSLCSSEPGASVCQVRGRHDLVGAHTRLSPHLPGG